MKADHAMRSRTLVGAVLLLLGTVAGCSSDPEPDDPAPSTGSSSAAPSPTPSPSSGSPSTSSETGPASPTVTPAAGPEIAATDLGEPVLVFRLPADLDWDVQSGGTSATASLPAGDLAEIGGRSIKAGGEPLDFYVRLTQRAVEPLGLKLERVENRVVDGVEGYVVEGSNADGFAYYFGAIHGDVQADVFFKFPTDGADARAVIESVLASAEWV